MRLGQDRKKQVTVQAAWDGLKGLKGVNSTDIKDKCLIDYLVLPPGAWQEKFMIVTNSLQKTDKMKVELGELTRGELHQKHGLEEAERLIEKGWFDSYVDESGVEIFIKRSKSRTFELEKTERTDLRRSARLIVTEFVLTLI